MNTTYAQLGEVAEFINGVAFKPEDWEPGGLRIIRIQNLTDVTKPYNRTNRKVHPKYHVQFGDLLVSWSASLGVFEWNDRESALVNQHIFRVLPNEQLVDRRYLRYGLEGALNKMSGHLHGATMQHVNRGEFLSTKIPLPPLPEQRRIAEILDHADTLRAKRRAAIAKLDSLAQSIFLDMFGDPVTNPRRWPSVSLPEACHTYSGGTPSKANSALWEGDLPWFSAKDLKQNDLFDSIDHISRNVPNQSNLRLLPANTVVTVVRGMILAHTFPVCVLRVPATINQDLKAFIPREDLDSQFLAVMLRCQSRHVLGQVSEAGHGTKRLDAEALTKIRTLLPPKSLQSSFTSRVAAVEKLREAAVAQHALSNTLFSALQEDAFGGGALITPALQAAHA
jgi:type I restriction enzyme S subunit